MEYPVKVPDWKLYRGDYSELRFEFEGEDSVPIPLDDWNNWSAAWLPSRGELRQLEVTAEGNAVTVAFPSEVTQGVETINGSWDVQAENNGRVRTWLRGQTKLTKDVTP